MGESDPHSQSRECVSRCVLVAWALGLCTLLFLNPGRALADLGDDLEAQYQDLQKVTGANTEQITIRQDVLDKMSNHVSRASPAYRSLQNLDRRPEAEDQRAVRKEIGRRHSTEENRPRPRPPKFKAGFFSQNGNAHQSSDHHRRGIRLQTSAKRRRW